MTIKTSISVYVIVGFVLQLIHCDLYPEDLINWRQHAPLSVSCA